LLVLAHELPENSDLEVTAINFADAPVDDTVPIRGATTGAKAIDVLDSKAPPLEIAAGGHLRLKLQAFEGRALRIKR
jgi:hypothetical protein